MSYYGSFVLQCYLLRVRVMMSTVGGNLTNRPPALRHIHVNMKQNSTCLKHHLCNVKFNQILLILLGMKCGLRNRYYHYLCNALEHRLYTKLLTNSVHILLKLLFVVCFFFALQNMHST